MNSSLLFERRQSLKRSLIQKRTKLKIFQFSFSSANQSGWLSKQFLQTLKAQCMDGWVRLFFFVRQTAIWFSTYIVYFCLFSQHYCIQMQFLLLANYVCRRAIHVYRWFFECKWFLVFVVAVLLLLSFPLYRQTLKGSGHQRLFSSTNITKCA